jgi:CubicO group peptidase (beta-lactamase class C family)
MMKTTGNNKNNGGLNPKRLKNIDAYLQRIVDQRKVAGAAGMIVRHGTETYCSSFGMRNIASKAPLKNDSIYRIWSMSKTFTVVAAMTLYEKAFFRLHQPIADFLPFFRDIKVAETD